MATPFDTRFTATPTQHSDFTIILGCVIVGILLTGGTLLTARLVMYVIGWQ